MLLALKLRHFVSSSWCQKWRRLEFHHLSKTFAWSSHRTSRTLFLARDWAAQLPPRYAPGSLLMAQKFHCSLQIQKKRQPDEQPPRELDLLRYDMRDLNKGPKPALYLGFCGLLPFVSAPIIMGITGTYLPELAYAEVVYGASVVSFFGGARWGFALPEGSPAKPDWLNLANSAVPSLIAWLALLFSNSITQSGMLVIMGLGISLHYDLALLPTYPSWFKAFRAVFTMVAFFSIVGTLIIKELYPEKRYLSEK
ncbi:transmembrane protein 69 isoform X2 [Electrophorus electricus]|nr:transmembrane protein 69 isoform X2 [Electrophorus electricus]XP_035380359.1 transmembrane protein 69 isoform X2 [Electrophorus electricus]